VRYSFRDDEGRWAASLTLEQLEGVHPELYEIVKSASARGGTYLDARIGGMGAGPRAPAGSEVDADADVGIRLMGDRTRPARRD
jgi:hypothetical protein